MKTKTGVKNKVNLQRSKEKYSDKLIQEIKEARKDYMDGNYYKGTADEVIKKLHDEVNQIKKVQ